MSESETAAQLSICLKHIYMGFPGGSVVKNSPTNAGDVGWERSPGEGNGNPLQCSCRENPKESEPGGQQFTGLQKSQTRRSN